MRLLRHVQVQLRALQGHRVHGDRPLREPRQRLSHGVPAVSCPDAETCSCECNTCASRAPGVHCYRHTENCHMECRE